MSFGELCVLVIVAIVVIGPKDLPRYLRKAGQLAGKLRRMATDVRAQSGIDEVLRSEGLTKDIAEIRRLTSGDFITSTAAGLQSSAAPEVTQKPEITIVLEREYPREGADSYGAITDDSIVYAAGLPVSPLARDPLYVVGDADAALPPPEPLPEPEPEPIGEEPTGAKTTEEAEVEAVAATDVRHA